MPQRGPGHRGDHPKGQRPPKAAPPGEERRATPREGKAAGKATSTGKEGPRAQNGMRTGRWAKLKKPENKNQEIKDTQGPNYRKRWPREEGHRGQQKPRRAPLKAQQSQGIWTRKKRNKRGLRKKKRENTQSKRSEQTRRSVKKPRETPDTIQRTTTT